MVQKILNPFFHLAVFLLLFTSLSLEIIGLPWLTVIKA
jgi:hypothetical protein